ncbi:MAG: NTE family protein [Myxococcota bacterium]|jgi:NTE family protein
MTTLRQWLECEPFALSLSAGFFGFFAHAGMLRALEDEGLTPTRVSGSSAGALVAGLWGSGRHSSDLERMLAMLKRQEFWDPGFGAGLLKGDRFRQKLHSELAVRTFDDCRVPVAISVFDVFGRRGAVVESGDLAAAIHASCTYPGLFQPVKIAGRTYIDGGITDRSGLRGMPKGERVLYHHLSTRSKVRGRSKKLSWFPRRDGMLPLIIADIPAVGPFKLHRGMVAFEVARKAVQGALDTTVPEPGGDPHVIG